MTASSPPASDTTPLPAAPRGALLIVFLTVFIDLLGFGIVLPVMPRQAEPYLDALGLSPIAAGATIGVLFSVFSLMQFIFSPLWGRISDAIGRRPMLLLSLLGSVVFYALYGFAVTFPADQAATHASAGCNRGSSWPATSSALAGATIEEATRVHRVALRAEQVDDSAQIFWHGRRGRRHRCAR